MAKTVAKSDVFAKIGAKANKAFNSVKSKEVKLPGGGNLPAGIEGGVAKLTSMKFGEYEKGDHKGKPYFMAQGVLVNPDGSDAPWIVTLKDGTKVRASGMQTKFGPEPLCDTPAKKGQTPGKNARLTFEDHMDHVVNLFKLLAGKEAVEGLESASDLNDLGESLIEAGTYFGLRTWSIEKRKKGEPGYNPKYDGPDSPPPRVFETWGEAIGDFSQAESSGEEVEDEEEEEEEEEEEQEGIEEEDSEKAETEADGDGDDGADDDVETEEEAEEEAEDDGLDELAEEADKEKITPAVKKARKELTDKAVEAGYDLDEVKAAETFADVVEMIRNPKEEEESDDESGEDEEETEEEEDGEDEEEAEEESSPEVGSEYKYKPKGAKKAIDVEVIKINDAKALAYVKDSATKKAILDPKTKKPLGIPFAELSE